MARHKVIPVPRTIASLQGTLVWTRDRLGDLGELVLQLGGVPQPALADVARLMRDAVKHANALEDAVREALDRTSTAAEVERVALSDEGDE